MRMWLSKPLYEAIPYFYLMSGVATLGASLYVEHWIWPTICLVVGFACTILGLVIWLRRRDFRRNIPSPDADDLE